MIGQCPKRKSLQRVSVNVTTDTVKVSLSRQPGLHFPDPWHIPDATDLSHLFRPVPATSNSLQYLSPSTPRYKASPPPQFRLYLPFLKDTPDFKLRFSATHIHKHGMLPAPVTARPPPTNAISKQTNLQLITRVMQHSPEVRHQSETSVRAVVRGVCDECSSWKVGTGNLGRRKRVWCMRTTMEEVGVRRDRSRSNAQNRWRCHLKRVKAVEHA